MDRLKLAAQLTVDEGKRYRVYTDTVGKLTCGVGRNLSDRAFSDDEIALMLANDIAGAERDLDRNLPWWRTMNEPRQAALANLVFQLGIDRLLGFKNALTLLHFGRWDAAADEFLNSKWATQCPARAKRVTDQIRKGEYTS